MIEHVVTKLYHLSASLTPLARTCVWEFSEVDLSISDRGLPNKGVQIGVTELRSDKFIDLR